MYTFFKQKFCTVQPDGDSKKLFFSEEIQRYKHILEAELPIAELKLFIKFDQSLGDDKKKFDAYVSCLKLYTCLSSSHEKKLQVLLQSTILL